MKQLVKSLVCAVFIAVAGCAGSRIQESTGEYIDDSAITAKVKAALVKDPDVSALAVNVETYKGVVQISGFVNNEQQIDKAVQDARSVPGVKSVKNSLILKKGASR
jgi:hyperosmotically inducible protein